MPCERHQSSSLSLCIHRGRIIVHPSWPRGGDPAMSRSCSGVRSMLGIPWPNSVAYGTGFARSEPVYRRGTAMLRLAMTLALVLLPSLGFAQAPELAEAGKLTWGASVTFPPFEFADTGGKPIGFDIDFTDAVAKR